MRCTPALTAPLAMFVALGAFGGRARADDGVETVTVRGARSEPGSTSIGGEDVRQVPGAFGDPGRVIGALPGVVSFDAFLPFFYVRGSTPSNTGYFYDGIRVPFVSHAPPGGTFLAPSLIDRVEFFPGASPVRFGRVAGAVLSVDARPPSTVARGEAALRAYDASGLVETPFADGRGSVTIGGLYGYSQALLAVLEPSAHQDYWDYHARASWELSRDERISVIAFGSRDYAGTDSSGTIFDAQFHRTELRYDVRAGDSHVRLAATAGLDVTGNDIGRVHDRLLALRVDSEHRASDTVRARVGAGVNWDRYDVTVTAPTDVDPQLLFAPRNDVNLGAYGELAWRPIRNVEIDPGVRVDLYASKRDEYPTQYDFSTTALSPLRPPSGEAARVGVDPRLSTRVRVHPKADFFTTFGLAHQPPSFFLPGLVQSRLEDGLQKAVQASQGIEVFLPADVTARATLFLSDYLDLNDPAATCPDLHALVFNPTPTCFGKRVRGQSYGAELLVRRSLARRLTGWISYTLSRTTREAHPPSEYVYRGSPDAAPTVLSEWDRTHVLTLVGAYDLGAGWRTSARFFYNTGAPYSRTILGVPVPPFNQERLPDFYRVDLRLEKRWRLGERGRITLVLEGYNVTLSREVTECRPTSEPTTGQLPPFLLSRPRDPCTYVKTAAYALPSVGLEGAF